MFLGGGGFDHQRFRHRVARMLLPSIPANHVVNDVPARDAAPSFHADFIIKEIVAMILDQQPMTSIAPHGHLLHLPGCEIRSPATCSPEPGFESATPADPTYG